MKSASANRWQSAQKYERHFWATRGIADDFDYYQVFADELRSDLKGILEIGPETTILEIGSGAAGIVTFLPSKHRHAIDPLEHFYSKVDKFASLRDPGVIYHDGMGEELPLEDGTFDLVIMDNVLDHCQNPAQVLSEVTRVLRHGGVFYFQQNVYHPWGKFVRSVMEWFAIDRGHPFTFTGRELLRRLETQRFTMARFTRTGYFVNWRSDLFAGKSKELMRALLFATRDRRMWILRKAVQQENS